MDLAALGRPRLRRSPQRALCRRAECASDDACRPLQCPSIPPITDPNLTQWKRISIDDKLPPDGAKYVQVHVQMRSTVPSSYVWFDDVTTLTKRMFLPLILK